MSLGSVSTVKTLLGITDSSQDALLAILLAAADAAAKTYIRRGKSKTAFTNWPETGSDTVYLSGEGKPDLILPYWPVTAVSSVYLDQAGYFGDGASAFAATSLLTAGMDYVLVRDDGSASTTARLRRLSGFGTGGLWGDDFGGQWSPGRVGTASGGPLSWGGRERPCWPAGSGNVKVTFTAGYTSVPADLTMAVNDITILLYNNRTRGGQQMQSESLGDYSYSLASQAVGGAPELGTARQMLNAYRETACF